MEGRRIITWGLLAMGIVIIVGYSGFALAGYVRGPRIELATPVNGSATTTALITIAGRAIHTSVLAINGATTSPDIAGAFSERLLLAPGYNIMKVTAEDRYGRRVEETIEMTLIREQLTINPAFELVNSPTGRTFDEGTTSTGTTTTATTTSTN